MHTDLVFSYKEMIRCCEIEYAPVFNITTVGIVIFRQSPC